MVVKHFMIELQHKLLQQVKYEGVDTLEDVIGIVERKEASFKLTSILPPKDIIDIHPISFRASSSINTLYPSNTLLRIDVIIRRGIQTRYNVTLARKWVIFQGIVRIVM